MTDQGDEYIGQVVRTTGDGETSFGQEATDLWLCRRCGAVVGWLNVHDAFHRRVDPAPDAR